MSDIVRERIVIDSRYVHGKPSIRDTRVPVIRVLGSLAARMTRQEIVDEYGVTEEDIDAALTFAVNIIESETFRELPLITS